MEDLQFNGEVDLTHEQNNLRSELNYEEDKWDEKLEDLPEKMMDTLYEF